MKKHYSSMTLSLFALAVMASPLTLDQVMTHHYAYRSIASDVNEPVVEPVAVVEDLEAALPVEAVEPEAKVIVVQPVNRPAFGPVNEVVAPRDMVAFNRFVTANQVAVNAVTTPFSIADGEAPAVSFQNLEQHVIQVHQDTSAIKTEIAQLLTSATRDSSSAALRDRLVNQVGRFQRLEQDLAGLRNLEAVRAAGADALDLASPTLPAVKSELDEAIASLEQLDSRIAELKAVPLPVAPVAPVGSCVADSEPRLRSEQTERRARAERIIAAQERLEREKRCAPTQTPAVTTPQLDQMQMMMMSMISMNQTMLGMIQLQIQQSQNMMGNYFNQGSWPSQNYTSVGLGSPLFAQFQSAPINPYAFSAGLNQLNQPMQPQPINGLGAVAQPLNGSFNFGILQNPTASFGNFQPFSSPGQMVQPAPQVAPQIASFGF